MVAFQAVDPGSIPGRRIFFYYMYDCFSLIFYLIIFNVDEKGVAQDHKLPSIVAGTDYHPNAVTVGRSKTATILGCGSAGGVAIPPFFVFEGKRMLPELMEGAIPEAAGTVSDWLVKW